MQRHPGTSSRKLGWICAIAVVIGIALVVTPGPVHADGWLKSAFQRMATRIGRVTTFTARGVIRVGRKVGRTATRVVRNVIIRPGRKTLRVARELIAVGLGRRELLHLQSRGFVVKRRSRSGVLGKSVTRIEIPPGQTLSNAQREISAVAPQSIAVSNTLYYRMALATYETSGEPCRDRCDAFELTNWRPAADSCQVDDVLIGVIDTRVDISHPSLVGARVLTNTTRSPERQPSSDEHGTGVVSLLVGRPGSSVLGVAQNAQILAADAFHSDNGSDTADVYDLVLAIDWLVARGVKVINLSISGPDNPLLQQAIRRALASGITIVAAAGKAEAPSVGYPGRYEGVIAVSSVDRRLRPSRLSLRGKHIAFAAPGVGLSVAGPHGSAVLVDGTSFAAPFVAAAFAMAPGATHQDRERALRRKAKDLGSPGRDPIFGWGLIQFPTRPGC